MLVPCCNMESQNSRRQMVHWIMFCWWKQKKVNVWESAHTPQLCWGAGCQNAPCRREIHFTLSPRRQPGQGRGSESKSFWGGAGAEGHGLGGGGGGDGGVGCKGASVLLWLRKGSQWDWVLKNPWKFQLRVSHSHSWKKIKALIDMTGWSHSN